MKYTDHMTQKSLSLLMMGVCIGVFLVSVDGFIINVALPTIAGELGVRSEISIWLITIFILPYTVSVPLAGNLATRYGNKIVFLAGLIIFSIGSFICGFAYNYTYLLFCRLVQGCGAGMLIPSSRGLISLNFPKDKRVLPVTLRSFAVMVGPAFGPILGGLLSNVHWHWLFFSAVPVALCCFLIVAAVPTLKSETKIYRFDWIGFALMVVFILALQVTLDRGQLYDWLHSKIIVTCLVAMFVSFPLFLVWELYQLNPMVYLYAFAKRNFTIATISASIALSLIFASFSLDVLWLHRYMGYPPMWAGLTIFPIGFFPILLYPMMTSILKKYDPRAVAFLGALAFVLAFFLKSKMNLEISFTRLAVARLIQGIGFPLLTTPSSLLYTAGFSDEKMPMINSLYSFARMITSAIGVAVGMILWIHRQAFYLTRLSARTYLEDERFTGFLSKLEPIASSAEQLTGIANQAIAAQAATLALADIYHLFMWITAIVCFLVLLYDTKVKA